MLTGIYYAKNYAGIISLGLTSYKYKLITKDYFYLLGYKCICEIVIAKEFVIHATAQKLYVI